MISNKDKVKMFEMRLEGCTLQEIADVHGVTRERVRQILQSVISRSTAMKRGREGIIYPNISEWMQDNDISIEDFGKLLGKEEGIKMKNHTRLSHILKGVGEFNMTEVKSVLKVTGMTFEKAFKLESEEE